MENIGQANVFHDFLDFPGCLAGLRRFFANPEYIGQANIFNDFGGFLRQH